MCANARDPRPLGLAHGASAHTIAPTEHDTCEGSRTSPSQGGPGGEIAALKPTAGEAQTISAAC